MGSCQNARDLADQLLVDLSFHSLYATSMKT